jgi:hypothetical protein
MVTWAGLKGLGIYPPILSLSLLEPSKLLAAHSRYRQMLISGHRLVFLPNI